MSKRPFPYMVLLVTDAGRLHRFFMSDMRDVSELVARLGGAAEIEAGGVEIWKRRSRSDSWTLVQYLGEEVES